MVKQIRKSRFVTRAAIFTAIVLPFAGAARAQPVSSSAASVEWEAANSCLIVRAVIEDISEHALKYGLHGNSGIHRFRTVSVRVLETLKGTHADRLQFVEDGNLGPHRLSDLQQSKQEVLLFLEPWIRSSHFHRDTGGYAYTRFPNMIRNVLLLTPNETQWAYTSVPVLSDDLTRLVTPSQTLAAIKSYLTNPGDRSALRTASRRLPPELCGGFYEVHFAFSAPQDLLQQPVLEFGKFEQQFAKEPPTEKKPSYSRHGRGYVGVHALELMAADCDVVVRGLIEDACFVNRTSDPTGDSYGVKFRVVETIQGHAANEITCFVGDARDLAELRRDKQELILFLRSNRNSGVPYPEGALEYRARDRLWDDSAIVLDKDSAEVLFADLSWHRDPAEIVARLRAGAKRAEKNADKQGDAETMYSISADTGLPSFDFHPPASLVAGTSIAGNAYSIVYLPVNRELEDNARKWATETNKDLRWLAARAMVYFKSDKNAAILKGMLGDETAWDHREMWQMTRLAFPHEPDFLVRWEAWHVLSGWGYEPAEVVFGANGK